MKLLKFSLIISALALCINFYSLHLLSQTGAAFISVAAVVPPQIGQPGVSLSWDTTNKMLVVTYSVDNAAGVASNLTTVSYNPHLLENVSGGSAAISFGGVALTLRHNLPGDPLFYQIGTASAVLATCSTVSPVPTGQTACPVIPF